MSATGYIDASGKYHRGEDKAMGHDLNPMHKQWRHDEERKRYAREITQPHKYGKPNPDFIRSYPEESKDYFTEEEIKRGEREI